MFRRFHAYLDQAVDGGDPAPSAGGAAAPAAAPAAPASASALLAAGGQPSAAPAPAATPEAPLTPWDKIPEKYRVNKEDGTPDIEASSGKLAEAYAHLEKRMGVGDTPPKSADEYAVSVPETLAQRVTPEKLAESADFQAFKAEAHALGLTQKQFDGMVAAVMQRTFSAADKLAEMSKGPSVEDVRAELQRDWPSPAQFQKQMTRVDAVFDAYLDEKDAGAIEQLVKVPAVMRMLAKIGAELEEDQPIIAGSPEATSWDEQVQQLRANPAYTDKAHPEHRQIMEKMDGLYAKRYGTKQHKIGGGVAISTAR